MRAIVFFLLTHKTQNTYISSVDCGERRRRGIHTVACCYAVCLSSLLIRCCVIRNFSGKCKKKNNPQTDNLKPEFIDSLMKSCEWRSERGLWLGWSLASASRLSRLHRLLTPCGFADLVLHTVRSISQQVLVVSAAYSASVSLCAVCGVAWADGGVAPESTRHCGSALHFPFLSPFSAL